MTEENKTYTFAGERNLLHEQLRLLAERSKTCSDSELAEISAQMVAIYSTLYTQH